jgi:hypothetical protein
VQGVLPAQLKPIAGPIDTAVNSFIYNTVHRIVTSPQFASLWDSALRVSHKALLYVLQGPPHNVSIANGKVQLDLNKLLTQAQQQLEQRGFSLANTLPGPEGEGFTLLQNDNVQKVQKGYKLLNTVGNWLPVIALLLLAGGVLLARNRRRALIRVGLYVTLGMIVLLILLSIGRSIYLKEIPPSVLPTNAATAVYDTLIRFLREAVLATLTLGLIVAVVAFFSGTSRPAVAVRGGISRVLGRLGGAGERARILPAGLQAWFLRFRWWLWAADIVLILVLVIFVDHSSAEVEIWWTVLGLALLAIIETIRARTPGELAAAILAVQLPAEGTERAAAVESTSPSVTIGASMPAASVASVGTATATLPRSEEAAPEDAEEKPTDRQ